MHVLLSIPFYAFHSMHVIIDKTINASCSLHFILCIYSKYYAEDTIIKSEHIKTHLTMLATTAASLKLIDTLDFEKVLLF